MRPKKLVKVISRDCVWAFACKNGCHLPSACDIKVRKELGISNGSLVVCKKCGRRYDLVSTTTSGGVFWKWMKHE